MPQIVDVIGYGKIEFPDGMSKTDMADALKKLPPKETTIKEPEKKKVEVSEADMKAKANPFANEETIYDPVSGAPIGTGAPVGATLLSGATGVLKPMAGALQLLGINKPAQTLEGISKTSKDIGGTPASIAEFGGELASPLPLKAGALAGKLMSKTPLGKSVMATTGAQGAIQGLLSPTETTPDMSYTDVLSEKAKQAGLGAGLGALAGKGTQMLLSPKVSPEMQKLKDMGMTQFTPGQLMSDIPLVGKGIQKMEQELTSLPLSGSIIQSGLERTAQQFNRGVANKILEPIGEVLPKNIKPGNEMMSYLANKVDDSYRGLENKISLSNVTNPKTKESTMDFFIKKYTDAAMDKPIEHQRLILDEFKNALLDNFQRKGTISGAEFRQAEKALGGKAKAYMSNPATQDVGFALRNLQDALRNELAIQNPVVGNELRASHEMFKRYLRAERAAAYRGSQEGVFGPSQFRSATETLAGRRGTATGQGMFMPESQAATSVLGKTMPDSGTAGRLMTPAALGRTMGLGAAEGGANLATLGAPLATTGMLYNPLSMYLMTKLATSRPGALQQASPYAAPMAARAAAIGANQ